MASFEVGMGGGAAQCRGLHAKDTNPGEKIAGLPISSSRKKLPYFPEILKRGSFEMALTNQRRGGTSFCTIALILCFSFDQFNAVILIGRPPWAAL